MLKVNRPTGDQCCGSGSGWIRTFWSDPDPVKFSGSGSGSDHKKSYNKNKSNKLNICENYRTGTFLKIKPANSEKGGVGGQGGGRRG